MSPNEERTYCQMGECALYLETYDQASKKIIPGKGDCAINGICRNLGLAAMMFQQVIIQEQNKQLLKGMPKIISPN